MTNSSLTVQSSPVTENTVHENRKLPDFKADSEQIQITNIGRRVSFTRGNKYRIVKKPDSDTQYEKQNRCSETCNLMSYNLYAAL
jgi:hypothetical protein